MCIRDSINSELDELDREEFYRLKKVQEKKQQQTAELDEQMKQAKLKQSEEAAKEQKETNTKQSEGQLANDEKEESKALVTEQEDDVIF